MQVSEIVYVGYTVRVQSYNSGPIDSSVDIPKIWVRKMFSYNHTHVISQTHAGVTKETGC